MLPVTTALAYDEPAHTQAIEWLIEERVRAAVKVVAPRGEKRNEFAFAIGKDRRGRKRIRNLRVGEPFITTVQEAHQLLHKYGRGAPITLIDGDGNGLPPKQQTYLLEVELEDNAELVMELNRDGSFAVPERSYSEVDGYDYEADPYDDDEVDLDAGDDDGAGERAAAAFAAALEAAGAGEDATETVVDEPAAEAKPPRSSGNRNRA